MTIHNDFLFVTSNSLLKHLQRSLSVRTHFVHLTIKASAKVTAHILTYRFWNHRRPRTPPIPRSSLNTSVIGTPAYNNSCPLSSHIDVINDAGLRIRPSSCSGKKVHSVLKTSNESLMARNTSNINRVTTGSGK